MKKNKAIIITLLVAAAALAVTGCWFCRHCHLIQRTAMLFRPSSSESGEFGLMARRGRILAADGSPLAYTERAWRFLADPVVAEYHKIDSADCREAAHGLGVDESHMSASLARKDSRYVFLRDANGNDPAVAYFERNRKWLRKYVGVIREPFQKRVYPLGEAATPLVGFMRGGACTDTPRGAGGIEWAFDKALAGTNGAYEASLRLDERVRRVTPAPGADIRTTIVPGVQKAVWGALAAACATNGAESAFALVMKIPSGEIEAMASWPSFDPSMRRDLDKWNASMAVNRAAKTVFEPGGLVRPIVAAIACESGVAADGTNVVSLTGVEKFHAALRRFGFGAKTRTAGISGEESGILASNPESWDTTAAVRVGMGYGFAVTGLQVAQAYATLANRGTLVRPVLIAGAASSCETNGATQVVSPAAADSIVRMLNVPMPSTVQMSEHDKDGGRSVYSSTNYIASCAGLVPADKPQHVIVVSFVKPRAAQTGDEVARPVLYAITDALLP